MSLSRLILSDISSFYAFAVVSRSKKLILLCESQLIDFNCLRLIKFHAYRVLNKMLKKIKSLASQLDSFSAAVAFNRNGNQKEGSPYGALGTLISMVLFAGIFNDNFAGFFNKDIISFTTSFEVGDNFSVKLTYNNTLFAIGLTGINLYNNSLFKLAVTPVTRLSNGSKINFPKLTMQPCSRKHWASMGFESYFDSNKMSEYLCASPDFNFSIKGQYGSTIFSYLKVSLSPACKNSTSCRSAIINQTNQLGGYLQLNMVYQNTAINYRDTYRPYTAFPDKSYYRFVPFYTFYSVDHFIQKIRTQTDISLLPFQDLLKIQNITFSNKKDKVEVPFQNQTQFFRCHLRIDAAQQILSRSVMSLEDFMSFVGGLFSVLSVLGAFLFEPYSKISLFLNIFNQLFQVRGGSQFLSFKKAKPQLQISLAQYLTSLVIPDFLKHKLGMQQLIILKRAYRAVEQQLDISNLLKRVRRLQNQIDVCEAQVFERQSIDLSSSRVSDCSSIKNNQHFQGGCISSIEVQVKRSSQFISKQTLINED